MKTTSIYRKINKKVDNTMKILDQDISVPVGLTEKIMSNLQFSKQPKIRYFNYSIYAQVAAVIAAGIFLGVVLGKNADAGLLMSKEMKKQHSLIAYKASHHLDIDRTYIFK